MNTFPIHRLRFFYFSCRVAPFFYIITLGENIEKFFRNFLVSIFRRLRLFDSIIFILENHSNAAFF